MTRTAFLLALALSTWTATWAGDAIAEDYTAGTIEIDNP